MGLYTNEQPRLKRCRKPSILHLHKCTLKKSTRNLCVHCRGEVALTTMEGKHVHSHFTILTGPVDQ